MKNYVWMINKNWSRKSSFLVTPAKCRWLQGHTRRLQGRRLPCLVLGSGHCWQSWCFASISASVVTWHSPCVSASLCPNLPLLVWTPSCIALRAHSISTWPHLNLIASAITLFLIKVTFTCSRRQEFWKNTIQHYSTTWYLVLSKFIFCPSWYILNNFQASWSPSTHNGSKEFGIVSFCTPRSVLFYLEISSLFSIT